MTEAIRFYRREELLDTQRDWNIVMPVITARIDSTMSKVENLACKSGCAHCCKLKVAALPHDIVAVVEYIRYSDRFTLDERLAIRAKLEKVVAQTKGLDEDQYRALEVYCPFLGDDMTCSVYEVRPVTCRAFGSTNVEVCAQTIPDDGSTFRVVPDSLKRLLATSGLFFVPFLQSCLDWWKGKGLESRVDEEVVDVVAETQQMLDRGEVKIARINGSRR